MGSLEFDGAGGGIHIGAVSHLAAKFRGIGSRGYRRSPTLLIYADDGSDEAQREAAGLAALNIAVRRVETFDEACRVCAGRPHT